MSSNEYSIYISKSDTNNDSIVTIKGNLTIENSEAIHEYLLKKAFNLENVIIKIEQSDYIDLSFVQLIVGFNNSRKKLNKETSIELNIDESMLELLEKSGSSALFSLMKNNN